MSDKIGSVLGGCELLEVIGKGGMGTVYRAHQRSLDRDVAVKVLPTTFDEDPSFVERFIQEARSIARLSHPNVVQVFDTGDESGAYFILMELVSGGTLKDKIVARRPATPLDVMDIVEQAALGLGAAHQQGIIHRDIKPGNIMFGMNRTVKVADFGLAKAIAGQNELTSAGEVVGTPAYMSPEQCEGQALDQRTDIYSLGATAFHFATGRALFSGDSALQVMYKHINEKPELANAVRPDLPLALAAIIDRCVAKDPYDRYQDVDELILDLHRAADNKPVEPYRPGQGRARLGLAAQDALDSAARPESPDTQKRFSSATIYKKRELSAKEQEQRADRFSSKGQWAFALLAYKEALKAFPDSDNLKKKVADTQARVDQEAMDDDLAKVRRLLAEGKIDQAYDVVGRAIKTAPNDELKARARRSLNDVQNKERAVRAVRRNKLIFTLVLVLAVATGGAVFLWQWHKDRAAHAASAGQPAPTPVPAPPPADAPTPPPDVPEEPPVPDDVPEDSTGTAAEDDLPSNPFLRALIENARRQAEGDKSSDTPSDSPRPDSSAADTAADSRGGFADGSMTFQVPAFMRPVRDTANQVAYGGFTRDRTMLSISVSRSASTSPVDVVAGDVVKSFESPAGYNGRVIEKTYRPIPGAGRSPEIRGEYHDEKTGRLSVCILVTRREPYTYIVSFSVNSDKLAERRADYDRIIDSIVFK
ncbi:MAG: protein kinase [Planctomycetes bacterium]|nr:protein kinase [Planctomycetota bacterium]